MTLLEQLEQDMANTTHFNSTSDNMTAVIFPNSTSFNTTNHNDIITSTPSGTPNNAPNPFYRNQATIIAQVTLLVILGVVIILGNLVSIVTFLKTQSLRRRCHYLVISLSFADLLVGVNDFMAVYFFLTGPQFNMFLVAMECVDTFTGIASILTLAAISVERFFAIYFPFRHRMVRFKFYMAFTAFPWITAITASVLWLIAFFTKNATVLVVYTHKTFVVGTLALVTILASYVSIGFKIRQINPSAQNQNRTSRERKLAVTLLIVTLASLVTWLPLQCFLVVLYMCETCPLPHFNVLFIMKFLQFLNSGINVFIYIIRMPEFRKAFVALLCNQGDAIDHPSQDSTRSDIDTVTTKNVYMPNEKQRKSVSFQKNESSPSNDNAGFTLNSSSNLNNYDRNVLIQNQSNLKDNTSTRNQSKESKADNEHNVDYENSREQGRVQNGGVMNYGFSKDNADTRL